MLVPLGVVCIAAYGFIILMRMDPEDCPRRIFSSDEMRLVGQAEAFVKVALSTRRY